MTRRSSAPRRRGQGLVEFALLLPLLLLLLLGIIEFGMAVFAYNTTANVGREVARFAVVHPEPTAIAEFIDADNGYSPELQRWTTGMVTDTLWITPTCTGSTALSSTIQVTVTYTYHFITGPIILAVGGDPDVDLQTVTTMFAERPCEVEP
jgi:Flp pilus assembly protein TadG